MCLLTTACAADPSPKTEARPTFSVLSVNKVWSAAPHNAFTDLVRYRDRWVCAFREAPEHKGGIPDSRIRLLTSDDEGETWRDAGSLADARGDIRDAKMAVMPDGRLMLLTAIQLFDKSAGTHQSIAYFTDDLRTWDGPHDVGDPDYWMWAITWHDGAGYTIGYNAAAGYVARLYKTTDGLNYETLVDTVNVTTKPNESAIVFDGDTAYCLLRAFGPAYIGTAQPPYDAWAWKKLPEPVGGPELILMPGGRLLGGGRLYLPDKTRTTSLLWIDPHTAQLEEALRLPSGGDTSYPGFVLRDGVLYVSYYSSHEDGGKSSIYFARIAVDPAPR